MSGGSSNNNDSMKNQADYQQKSGSKGNFYRNRFNVPNNGYQAKNNYRQDESSDSKIKDTLEKVKQKQKKRNAKKVITEAISSMYTPLAGAAVDRALETPQGDKLLDAYAKGDTPIEGINNVKKEINKKKRRIQLIGGILAILLPLLLFAILVSVIFKNADSQIFSNENEGTYESDDYQYEDPDINIFKNYPGLYENVVEKVKKVSDKYKLEIDKFLIISTLIAPIENGLITPVQDGSCGEDDCYYFKEKSYTWTEFLKVWSDQSELLAKMQILTFVNEDAHMYSCSGPETMEQYAKNDFEIREHYLFWWINPLNWFSTFRDAVDAELNARCTLPPNGKTKVPIVYTISTEQADYYSVTAKDNETGFEKDENSGGVYFWNLVNKKGFIHEYLKDYLSDEYKDDIDKNYEINQKTIVDTVNYIYSYYESIRKDCEGHRVIESSIENINIYNPESKQSQYGVPEIQSIPFEDQYVGGVMLAEYNSGSPEALKAFAILARSEALSIVGLDGSGIIENSSNAQNYNPNYSPEKYPKIAEAVEATRGMVLSHYMNPKVWHTEYDAFCPVKSELENGFYYLPDGQNNLPINPDAYSSVAHKQFIDPNSEYLNCPCFQNNDSRPHDADAEDKHTRYYYSPTEAPTFAGGNPSQETKAVCWKNKGTTKTGDDGSTLYGWKYKPTGGHGRGASQYGLTYFGAFGYNQDALLRLFFEDGVVRIISSSLRENQCTEIPYFTGEVGYGSGSYSDYNEVVGGSPLTKPLTEALSDKGYTIADLNNCIGNRVTSAGMGTRAGVVEAGMGLLECTMDLTGGYTYPYDHRGGYIGGNYNPDIQGKLGVNSKWGEYADYATGCSGGGPCRLGLNCANFVRWAMCNGGMDLCSRGSTFATGMAGVNSNEDYFPGAIRVRLTPSFAVLSGSLDATSASQVIGMIQPGDVLYSDHNGSGNHVMLIVGNDQDSITIAENGRKTRKISKSELESNSMTYVVLLLDDYYANQSNKNSLSW